MYIGYYWDNYILFRAHAYSAGIRTKVNKFVQGIGNGREGIMEDYTTNVNGTAVFGEARVKTAGTKKRGVGKDVFLLVLIVFIAVSVLTGLTVAKSEQEVMPAESAIIEGEESVISFDENGNIVYESGAPEGVEDDPFFSAANIEQDEAGNVTVTGFDGTVTTYESGSIGFGMTEINLDEEWGIAPASPDKMVSDALEKAENVAYADTTVAEYGTIAPNARKRYPTSGGGSVGAWGGQASSGGGSDKTVYYAFVFNTAGTWYNFLSSMSSYIKVEPHYNPAGNGNRGNEYKQGWSGNNGSITTNPPSKTNRYYVFRAKSWGNAGGGKNDKWTAYAGMTNIHIYIWHTCGETPKISISTNANTWKQTQQVKVTANAEKSLLKTFSAWYPVLYSNTNYSTNPNVAYKTQHPFTSPAASPAAGKVSASVTTYTGKLSGTVSKPAYDLYIDNGNPVLDEIYFVASKNSKTKINSLVKECKYLYLYLKMHDTGYKGATSGITTIKATSDRGANYPINMNGSGASNSNSGGSVQAWIEVKAEDANGVWTIQIQDKTTTNISTYTNKYSFYLYDGAKPSISNFVVEANNPDFTMDGQAWTNDSLTITFDVKDYAVGTTYVDNAEISTVDISYKVNNLTKSIKNADITKTGSKDSKTCKYTTFMFDANVIQALTVTVYDKAGNKGEKTFTPSEMTIKGKLDTVAPLISSAKVFGTSTPWGAMDQYSAEDIQITVSVRDYNYSDIINSIATDSAYRFSNGAGISKLYFYADAAGTKPLNINGTNSNVFECQSVAGQTGLREYTVTIKHDTANSAFGGSIYFVAEDQVGNRSDGRNIPFGNHINKNENWGTSINSTVKSSGVYLYEGTPKGNIQ